MQPSDDSLPSLHQAAANELPPFSHFSVTAECRVKGGQSSKGALPSLWPINNSDPFLCFPKSFFFLFFFCRGQLIRTTPLSHAANISWGLTGDTPQVHPCQNKGFFTFASHRSCTLVVNKGPMPEATNDYLGRRSIDIAKTWPTFNVTQEFEPETWALLPLDSRSKYRRNVTYFQITSTQLKSFEGT